jgi:putative phosphoesterase
VRIGIVSDIHSNAPGLRTALDRMGEVDQLLCAGDIVEDYRFSNDVVELLRRRDAVCVLGNHDVGLLSASGARAREAPGVQRGHVEWLGRQPLRADLHVDGRRLVMTHASPCPPGTQYVWPRSPELKRLADVDADYVVLGHTHSQMVTRVGGVLVVNPGSVGEARDRTNGRRLSYAVLDTDTDEVVIDDYEVDVGRGVDTH